ncbi:hypothetical protein RHGRI_010575 [Rhododendron griersonianum]|uniref:Uncharacterized protein n=1 Tax=Rhododendron griersonianum TaxID=479676 RepID=A0AAV6KJV3_9ERIC|nr:hypothetical protein RHGRI_010575 [Rhododendron griersonianum]
MMETEKTGVLFGASSGFQPWRLNHPIIYPYRMHSSIFSTRMGWAPRFIILIPPLNI